MGKTNKNRKRFSQKKAKVKSNREVKSNPFEIRLNRQKHPILGKKRKHEKGNPGIARSKAVEKRKKTLLKEYQQRHKSNKFLDKRIGENDSTMSVEEKMMERFAFEKQKVHEKSAIFNLAEEEEELTHYGQSLAEIEKFEEELSDVGEEFDDAINEGHMPAEENFGGFLSKKTTEEEAADDKPKTRDEVILDIIANSKKEKFERQKEKEDIEDMTDELDKNFRDVSHLLAGLKGKSDAKSSLKSDDYDIMVKELMFESKAKATDRLKTPEEEARGEKARLEKLEADRKRRMLGITEDGEKKKSKHRSADELNDFYAIEPETKAMLSYKDGKPTNPLFLEGFQDNNDGGEDDTEDGSVVADDGQWKEEDEEVDEEAGSGDEEMESDQDDEYDDDLESDNESQHEEAEDGKDIGAKKKKQEMIATAKKELPFTFKVPADYNELVSLLYQRPHSEQITILERMRRCNHPSLAEGNKSKLESLLSLLVQYFCSIADDEPLNMELIHGLTKHVYELSKTSHIPTGNCFRDVLIEKYQDFKEVCERKGIGRYPSTSVLLYFKLLSLVFPTSDFKHCVITPTLLFMGEILSQCPVRSHLDIAKGIFICNTFMQYVHLSKRIVPEVINFLHGLLFLSKAKKDPGRLDQVLPPFKPIGKHNNYLVLTEDRSSVTTCPAFNISDIFSTSHDLSHLDNDDFRIWAMNLTLHLLLEFLKMYENQDSCVELFAPIKTALKLEWLTIRKYPERTQELHKTLLEEVDALDGKQKRALERTRKRPVSLKMFEPKFEDNYDPTRKDKSAGNKEKNEVRKLVHKHRQEMKGAMRELRKDTQFLAREKLQEQINRDAERKEKVRQLYGMLANQEGEVKGMMRKAKKVKF
ncbi:nucleolar protein 14-like isoform X2 [Apostichopus japonicus]